MRQAGDEIQMLVDIAKGADFFHDGAQTGPVVLPVDGCQRLGIGRLNADFKLKLFWADGPQKIQRFTIQQLGGNLKMKIGNAVIMVLQKAPDLQGTVTVAIKSAVDKFNLTDAGVQKKL